LNEYDSVLAFGEAHIAEYVRLLYHGPSDSGKTEVWSVVSQKTGDVDGDVLGQVKWFGRWRQYAFFPEGQTIYSKGCLDDIAKFVADINSRQKIAARQKEGAETGHE